MFKSYLLVSYSYQIFNIIVVVKFEDLAVLYQTLVDDSAPITSFHNFEIFSFFLK